MAETFPCPKCGRRLALLAKQVGKKGRCQACGTIFVVPMSAAEAPLPAAPKALSASAESALEDAEGSPDRAASRRGPGVGAFVASHRLMLAVVAVALAASVAISVVGQPLLGILMAVAGFGIAPCALMAVPEPHKSSSGKVFAVVAGLLLLNLIVLAAVFGYFRAPAGATAAIRAVYYLGLIAMLGIAVVLIAVGSWLMSRYGFFRPAAWGYVALAPCVLVAALFLSASPAPAPVVVVPPAPVKVAPPPVPAPAPAAVTPPPAPSIDPAQLQQMLDQVQTMAELSKAAQKLALDPQGGLDDLDRLAKKQQGQPVAPPAAASTPPPAATAPAPGSVGLEQKLSGMVAGLNELADTLATVRDEAGARSAMGKVREVIARTVALVNAPTSLDPQGVMGLKADAIAGHNARHVAAEQRVTSELTRLTPIPGTQELVAEVNRFVTQLRGPGQRR